MSEHPQDVRLKLHSAIEMATGLLDLPLTAPQREALAVELTGPVRALIAEALATAGDDSPVRYAVAEAPPDTEAFAVSEAGGCTSRVGLDVDLDSPAAVLGEKLRTSQYDVVATEVPDASTLGLTVRPQSLDCWRWWLARFGIDPKNVTVDGDDGSMTATGRRENVTVQLRVEGVSELLADRGAAWLMGLVPETTPARP